MTQDEQSAARMTDRGDDWALRRLKYRPTHQQAFGLEMFRAGFDTRTVNCFLNEGFASWDDVCAKSPAEMLRLPNFGRKCLAVLEGALAKMGRALTLKSCLARAPDSDKGEEYEIATGVARDVWPELADRYLQALHDRDRFQRERDYWREECIKLTGEALA